MSLVCTHQWALHTHSHARTHTHAPLTQIPPPHTHTSAHTHTHAHTHPSAVGASVPEIGRFALPCEAADYCAYNSFPCTHRCVEKWVPWEWAAAYEHVKARPRLPEVDYITGAPAAHVKPLALPAAGTQVGQPPPTPIDPGKLTAARAVGGSDAHARSIRSVASLKPDRRLGGIGRSVSGIGRSLSGIDGTAMSTARGSR